MLKTGLYKYDGVAGWGEIWIKKVSLDEEKHVGSQWILTMKIIYSLAQKHWTKTLWWGNCWYWGQQNIH